MGVCPKPPSRGISIEDSSMIPREYCLVCGKRLCHGLGSNIRTCKVCWQQLYTQYHIQGYSLKDLALLRTETQKVLRACHERDKILKAMYIVFYLEIFVWHNHVIDVM